MQNLLMFGTIVGMVIRGLRQAFRGNRKSARNASPIAGMYTPVKRNNAKIQIAIEIAKLLSITKANLDTADLVFVLFLPRVKLRQESFNIIAL